MRNGYGQFLVQIGGKSTDVPQLSTIVTDPLAKAVVALIQSQGDLARVTAGPPGIKPDILATLRAAYRAAFEDKEFLARAARLNLPIEPDFGDDVAKSVASALAQPPEKTVPAAGAFPAVRSWKPFERAVSESLSRVSALWLFETL